MPTDRGLQKELEVLIGSGQIQARIDSHNKVLYAKRTDQRNATFLAALRAGRLRVLSTPEQCLHMEFLFAIRLSGEHLPVTVTC